ncbi:MAG: hypothetical protein LBR55_04910 [Bacteroidales bacterium]|nr:hypothetical protein [Bacteroidales bacterium]
MKKIFLIIALILVANFLYSQGYERENKPLNVSQEDRIEQLERKISDLQGDIRDLHSGSNGNTWSSSSWENSIPGLKEDIDDLYDEFDDLQDEIDALRREISDLRYELQRK